MVMWLGLLWTCGGPARAGVCEASFPSAAEQGVCGNHQLEGVEVCACPVELGGDLSCEPPPAEALLAAHRVDGTSSLGTWPASPVATEAELRALGTGDASRIDAVCSGLSFETGGSDTWDVVDVVFSPDGGLLAVGDSIDGTNEHTLSLVGCGAESWSIERFLASSVWLTRWGADADGLRTLYVADQSLYRLRFDPGPVVLDDGTRALVLREQALLARKPDSDDGGADLHTADMDVVFGGEVEASDRFLAFLEGDYDDQDEIVSAIQLMDLEACELQVCEAEGWDYCCPTYRVAEYGPLQPNWYSVTAVTNPAFNADGSVLTFHWDSLAWGVIDENYSILYAMRNPLFDRDLLASCREAGAQPGFSEVIDCLDLVGADASGLPDCPHHASCGESCGICTAIGGPEGGARGDDGPGSRNLVSFFGLGGAEYVAFQRFTFGREGTGGDLTTWLDLYRIEAGAEGPAVASGDYPIVLEVATDTTSAEVWAPSAIRRLDAGTGDTGSPETPEDTDADDTDEPVGGPAADDEAPPVVCGCSGGAGSGVVGWWLLVGWAWARQRCRGRGGSAREV